MAKRSKGSRGKARASTNRAASTPTPIAPKISAPESACNHLDSTSEAKDYESDDNDSLLVGIGTLSLKDNRSHTEALPSSSAPTTIAAKPRSTQSFRFLDLPSELRLKIYGIHFFGNTKNPPTIDLSPENPKLFPKKLAILRVSRNVYAEASHFFYSSNVFRLFPIHPGRHFKTKRPLLSRLKTHQRQSLTTVELRVGPGWSKPPAGWVVKPALGLSDCKNVRTVRVFVQCDPSDEIFKGWRKSEGFYEKFCKNLLEEVLKAIPTVERVVFDAFPGVRQEGDMMKGLLDTAVAYRKSIGWGPESLERGWTDQYKPGEEGDEDDGIGTKAEAGKKFPLPSDLVDMPGSQVSGETGGIWNRSSLDTPYTKGMGLGI